MKKAVIVVVAAGALWAGIDYLSDLTQNRPDRVDPGSASRVVFRVSARTGEPTLRIAQGLWGACQGTVRHELTEAGVTAVGGGRFQFVTQPALGEHAWRRLKGCLEDMTLDRTLARVVSKQDFAAPPGPGSGPGQP